MELPQRTSVRTLLVSDVHLGCRHARPDRFLSFLRRFDPQTLYLVGDIFDAWKINSGWYWSEECDEVLAELSDRIRGGTRVYYMPGNHDAMLRHPVFRATLRQDWSNIRVADEFVFETLQGWRFLVTHGDLFDFFETKAQWLSKGSSTFYDACLSVNWWLHRWLMPSTENPYGICAKLKHRVKKWIRFISRYETQLIGHAKSKSCDGVICGHIHTPDICRIGSCWYCNTGDWIENCAGLVEYFDGRLELYREYDRDLKLRLPDRPKAVSPFEPESDEDVAAPAAIRPTQGECAA